jgi:hypothetical protein
MKTRPGCRRLLEYLTLSWAISFKPTLGVGRAPDRVKRLREGMRRPEYYNPEPARVEPSAFSSLYSAFPSGTLRYFSTNKIVA